MQFQFPMGDAPLPGERFYFGVAYSLEDPGGAPILVEARVDGVPQLKLECPDPPCHQLELYIDPGWDDSKLELVATSTAAETVTVSLPVGRPRPRPMATAG